MDIVTNLRSLAAWSVAAVLISGAFILPAHADESIQSSDDAMSTPAVEAETEIVAPAITESPEVENGNPIIAASPEIEAYDPGSNMEPEDAPDDATPENPAVNPVFQESEDPAAEPEPEPKSEPTESTDSPTVSQEESESRQVESAPTTLSVETIDETQAASSSSAGWDDDTPDSPWNPNVPAIEPPNSADAKLAASKFGDVSQDDWYAPYIGRALTAGIMTGYSGGSWFGPNDQLTRGQVATIIYRFYNPGSTDTSVPSNYARTSSFDDVAGGVYYTAAIEWCRSNGIVTGYSGTNNFGPEDQVTREQLAVMIWRALGQPATGGSISSFPDSSSISSYAVTAMAWCRENGVLTGDANTGQAMPQGYATRGQMAKMATVAFGI